MKTISIILDPAHGKDVLGKCSPDGRHKEYAWSRERVLSLKGILESIGYEVFLTTESEFEPGLSVRKNRASSFKSNGKKLLLSLHNNASGSDGNWRNANGIEVWTSPGVTSSDICADIILEQFSEDFKDKIRLYKPSYLEKDKEAKFTVLMGSGYMAVLIEWLFQDNRNDVEKLLDANYNMAFEKSLVKAIEKIDNYFKRNG